MGKYLREDKEVYDDDLFDDAKDACRRWIIRPNYLTSEKSAGKQGEKKEYEWQVVTLRATFSENIKNCDINIWQV